MSTFFIIAIVVIAFISYHLLTRERKKLKKFREEWASGIFSSPEADLNSISSYWFNKKKQLKVYDGVDELTWADLGMNEVFKKLNYTQSSVGEEYLFNELRAIDPNKKESNEALYSLFTENVNLREKILLILSDLGKENYTNSSSYFFDFKEIEIKKTYMYVILALLPIASLLFLFISIKYGIISFIGSLILNGIIYYRNKTKIENNLHSVGYAAAIIFAGKRIASLKDLMLMPYIDGLKKSVQPLKKVVTFNRIATLGSGGSGEFDLLLEYVRILFLLDFISYNKIFKTISAHQKEYEEVWTLVGKLDAAIAVSYYRNTLDTYCTPTFTDQEVLTFEKMAHPLLVKPVLNSSHLRKSTLITGSNASGKSTYIKAVAINAILAQTINTAIAKSWTMKPSYIVTSMAVQDNVLNGDSYFIAEIKSLQRIIRLITGGKPCISFIDEILKGTNTIERIAASASIMEWLSLNKGINLLATHDIELTEIAESIYDNYHFREKVEGGEVQFDYKIHDGPSISRNAIKLLEILGYPDEITKRSNVLAQNFTVHRIWEALKGRENSIDSLLKE
ncbi:hypothetical protein H9650_09140 [Psychrobacillus sp. Sa2BUA9]|uniref:DNA mismatch repair proteins mutS family domain-containing protein n=1 Tax=Psychrobacillus faecigallinarum TaxID=2762235 RepID=A0ABR8R910_9BACI|nr:hypothetical protein [Psychrobacillus faecigallinarum]MBD7944283.1 hypothetical protein [Psychrobacillus faecigallinarum]